MNYGLYLSAAGALSSLHRQDVLANNLANIETIGFKPDDVPIQSRLAERLESGTFDINPNLLLEQLGGGQQPHATVTNFKQGEITQTHNDLDLAIEGDGFFVVRDGHSGGGGGAAGLRFTRDGRFTLNPAGQLIMTATGMRVLDVNDQPIRVDRSSALTIDSDGSIVQNGAAVARIQISTIADKSRITKEGNNVLRFASEGSRNTKRQAAPGIVRQGSLEGSAVDPILAMNAMINASKSVQANATMMQYHDNILGQAVNTFGRVA